MEAVPIVAGGGLTKQVGDKPRWHKVMQGGTRGQEVEQDIQKESLTD